MADLPCERSEVDIGVVSVVSQYMVYNCVYYCDTCYMCADLPERSATWERESNVPRITSLSPVSSFCVISPRTHIL
jgi:hypothetical protein